ncbi:MAG: glycosyltransferase family 4 protein, partial [Firmicutes bacterium]|nr:glycosyltransferase family 4 protein [Bacillota bacterium]
MKPQLSKRMLSRFSQHITDKKVQASYVIAIKNQLFGNKSLSSAEMHRRQSEQIGKRIVASNALKDIDVIVGFVRDLPPLLCKAAREQGIKVIADQIIAPARIERSEILGQYDPGEQPEISVLQSLDSYEQWEAETWPLVDHLTCMSEYVRDGLLQMGIDDNQISVLHYPFDSEQVRFTDRSERHGKMVVGFVGTVCTRKGVKHFFEVARRLHDCPIRFVMVGPIRASRKLLAARPENVEMIGPVPRSSVAQYLAMFDVFYFPSCCEGSAGSVVEAMASGLPVVTSRNSGTYARNAIEGWIAPPDDIDQAASNIQSLLANPKMRLKMGADARKRVQYF